MNGIDPKGLRGFRGAHRRSFDPDATEGRKLAHAYAEAEARFSMWRDRKVIPK